MMSSGVECQKIVFYPFLYKYMVNSHEIGKVLSVTFETYA